MFNQQLAEQHLNKLLKQYRITVTKWSRTACGRASWKTREVKIPKPTNVERFCVAMHEVKHIIDGNIVDGRKAARFEQEFACDLFAREQALLLGFNVSEWDRLMNWHSLSRIAMAVNRRLDTKRIPANIRQWFSDVDFELWQGKKVFVRHSKTEPKGYTIEFPETYEMPYFSAPLGRL